MKRFTEHPAFLVLAVTGILDMAVQAATSGTVKPIQILLGAIFGHGA